MEKALEGIKVIDLTRVLAGPYASMMLGDLGAEVIKIETPETGDDSRGFGPFINGESIYFVSLNRNKKSLSLNLKTEEGKEIFRKLVKEADIILENYRPGTMEKLGLGYEELEKVNPGIIYGCISGFGHSGPYSQKPAYDLIVQGMGGIMSLTGLPDGPPLKVGASIGDITSGLFSVIGILTALHKRKETGKGQKVDIAMLDCQVAILENAIARYSVSEESPKPAGNRHPSIAPFSVFNASDGYFIMAVGNDNMWRKCCSTINREDLAADPRFLTNPDRNRNWDQLEQILNEVFAARTIEDWQTIFDEAGIPTSPINNIAQVVQNPQVLAREMIVYQDHPVAGNVMMPGIPVKLSKNPGGIDTPAPSLGEHNDLVLQGLGYPREDIQRLKNQGVI